ncbi:MAG: zinc-dependent alcohol dehydrogenase, partial [Alphaproteobacteria bacterium]
MTVTAKAAILRETGKPLTIETIEIDAPGPREVRIKTKACGVCHS